jgi:hypothetical protein
MDCWLGTDVESHRATRSEEGSLQWLIKRVLRSLFEAASFDLNCNSRDIYFCAKIAAQQFAPQTAIIWRTAELAGVPTDQPAPIFAVLDGLAPLLRRLQNPVSASRAEPLMTNPAVQNPSRAILPLAAPRLLL